MEGEYYSYQSGLSSSVAEFLPNFEARVRKALRVLLGEAGEKRIRIGQARDGSGIGGQCIEVLLGSERFG